MSVLDPTRLTAIDIHTHAEVSSGGHGDALGRDLHRASGSYFGIEGERRPTLEQIADHYRERNMACVVFPVDTESTSGLAAVANEEVAEAAAAHPDVLIPFASVDPAKGARGARQVRRLVEEYGVKGFKFHPNLQEFFPTTAPPTSCTRPSRTVARSPCSTPVRPGSVPGCPAGAASG